MSERLPEQAQWIDSPRQRLQSCRGTTPVDALQAAWQPVIVSATGGSVREQPQAQLLSSISKHAPAEIPEQELDAIVSATEIACRMGILRTPRVLPPLGQPKGKIVTLIPMAHPTEPELAPDREKQEMIVDCQVDLFRFEILLSHLGCNVPLHIEGHQPSRPFEGKQLFVNNVPLDFYGEQAQGFLFDNPKLLRAILSGFRDKSGSMGGFVHFIGNRRFIPLATERTETHWNHFKEHHRDAYSILHGQQTPLDNLSACAAAQESVITLIQMMNEDAVDKLSQEGCPLVQRAAIGAVHRDGVARLLQKLGTEVWITEPVHTPDTITHPSQHPRYLWAKEYLKKQSGNQ